MNSRQWLAGAAFILFAPLTWAANWSFDQQHTNVQFIVSGLAGVVGQFSNFGGEVSYDAQQIEKMTVSMDLDGRSLSAGVKTLWYKGSDGLAVDKFPQIRFVSTRVLAQGANNALLFGQLTMRGESHPVVWKIQLDPSKSSSQYLYFTANANISRSQWNMVKYSQFANDTIQLKVNGRLVTSSS